MFLPHFKVATAMGFLDRKGLALDFFILILKLVSERPTCNAAGRNGRLFETCLANLEMPSYCLNVPPFFRIHVLRQLWFRSGFMYISKQ